MRFKILCKAQRCAMSKLFLSTVWLRKIILLSRLTYLQLQINYLFGLSVLPELFLRNVVPQCGSGCTNLHPAWSRTPLSCDQSLKGPFPKVQTNYNMNVRTICGHWDKKLEYEFNSQVEFTTQKILTLGGCWIQYPILRTAKNLMLGSP